MVAKKPLIEIKRNYTSLSSHQKTIADFILNNVNVISGYSIAGLAKSCKLSNATVIRFLNKLGYHSYTDFKLDLVRELASIDLQEDDQKESNRKFDDGYQNIEAGASVAEVIQTVITSASSFISNMKHTISLENVDKAVNLICNANDLLFFGAGGSGSIALDGYHKFLRLGFNAFCDANSHLTLIRTAHLNRNSVVLLFSHTGESHDVIQCAKLAREVGCKIISITSYVNSSLVELSDVVLHSASYYKSHYTDALVSRLIQLVLLDILFVSTSLKMEPLSTTNIKASRNALVSQKNTMIVRKHK